MDWQVFQFQWAVPEAGFCWMNGIWRAQLAAKGESAQTLTAAGVGKEGYAGRIYRPLTDFPGLFRTFSETPPSEEGILEFANRYGPLGGEISGLVQPEGRSTGTLLRGERLSDWTQEIVALRQALHLWDLIQEGDLERLAEHIVWKDDGSVHYHSHPHLGSRPVPSREPDTIRLTIIASPQSRPELLKEFTPHHPVRPALRYIQDAVNRKLGGRAAPRLLLDPAEGELKIFVAPEGLIGALWLQLAQAIDGRKQYRRCAECAGWLEVSPQAARKNRLYCSNACRSRAYRGRQEEARRLHESGVSLKEIVKRLDTDSKTAKRWIGAEKSAVSQSGGSK